MHEKSYKRDHFKWLRIPCTESQARLIFNECLRFSKMPTFFDGNLMIAAPLPFGKWFVHLIKLNERKSHMKRVGRGMFCSTLCVEALQPWWGTGFSASRSA